MQFLGLQGWKPKAIFPRKRYIEIGSLSIRKENHLFCESRKPSKLLITEKTYKMQIRKLFTFWSLMTIVAASLSTFGQDSTSPKPPVIVVPNSETRSIRRDVPLKKSIRNAFSARTRNLTGTPGVNYWQNDADYEIYVRLDPAKSTLYGTETITYYNNSPDKLESLVLRLDHNLFRSRVPRGSSVPAEITDGMVVSKIKIDGEEIDLNARPPRNFRGGSPEYSFAFNLEKTVARIFLKNAIKPRSTARVEIEWHTKLPGGETGVGHRMTQRWGNRLFQPTQWFPRIAKYDDLRGWELSPYLGPSEFYNNYGKYDVKIEVPGGWLVSGTGILKNSTETLSPKTRARAATILNSDNEIMIVDKNERGAGKAVVQGDKLVYNYVADRVNDFAWAASKEFVWRATRAEIPGRTAVPIHMFYLPENEAKYENAGTKTRHALQFYSKFSGIYPFPQITLQDGPSAGMEYPMVINSNQGAADHETYHQWIPMMVGINETRYAWMDEGFNSYSNIFSRADAEGIAPSLDNLGQGYGRIAGGDDEAPLIWNSDYAGSGYGFQAYRKTSLMLSMLGGMVGDENVNEAIKKYIAAWKFKHPSPWDFMFFMDKELKRDLGWFWNYWIFENATVDGSIKEAKIGDDGILNVTVHQSGQMPSPVILLITYEESDKPIPVIPNARPLNRNQVVVKWDVDVWFNGSREFVAKVPIGDRKVKQLKLDPSNRFPDSYPSDNTWMPK